MKSFIKMNSRNEKEIDLITIKKLFNKKNLEKDLGILLNTPDKILPKKLKI